MKFLFLLATFWGAFHYLDALGGDRRDLYEFGIFAVEDSDSNAGEEFRFFNRMTGQTESGKFRPAPLVGIDEVKDAVICTYEISTAPISGVSIGFNKKAGEAISTLSAMAKSKKLLVIFAGQPRDIVSVETLLRAIRSSERLFLRIRPRESGEFDALKRSVATFNEMLVSRSRDPSK